MSKTVPTLPFNALQKAMYTRLTTDNPTLLVYSHLPQNSAFPYVTIGQFAGSKDQTKTSNGMTVTATINVWTQEEAMLELNTLMTSVMESLSRQPLTLEGSFREVFSDVETVDAMFEADSPFLSSAVQGPLQHGVVRYQSRIFYE
jgi:hypothetical protein